MSEAVSEIFDPSRWTAVPGFQFTDITYHRANDVGAVRIAFHRPEVRNAFRPHTVDELYTALDHARMSTDVGCVLLTGNGPSAKDGGWAFCSGGDQRIRGRDGYKYADGVTADTIDPGRAGRLHILECQRLIRFMPKVVICVVPGWAAGGGHSLHVVCDLTLASAEHARFKQTDSDVASFDGGFGSAYLARFVGQKFAREIFFLGREYTAQEMHAMGGVNAVVPHAELESTALQWAREICSKSPTAQRMLKYAFNMIDDGLVGQQIFAGEATRLAYGTDEAAEGRDAFLEKRSPDWSPFPYFYDRGSDIVSEFVPIDDASDPRLAEFRLNERGLANRDDKRDDAGAGLFLAEGDLVVERALAVGCRPYLALADGSRIPPVATAFAAAGATVYVGGDALRRHVTRLGVAQPIVALFHRPPRPSAAELLRHCRRLVIVEGVDNPANVGAIVRNAAAFGWDALLLDHTSADPLAWRALRVSMGTAFALPHARTRTLVDDLRAAVDLTVYALTPDVDAIEIRHIEAAGRRAVAIGSERAGLSPAVLALSTPVRIAMAPGVDSLNAAAAAAVACYALA